MQLSGASGVELDDVRPRRLSDLLREGFDGFSRSQKAIARYIIDHLEEVGYLSAEELGRKGSIHLAFFSGNSVLTTWMPSFRARGSPFQAWP